MWHLGILVRSGYCDAGLMVGLEDLAGLFQP